jgi:hypothetical protein
VIVNPDAFAIDAATSASDESDCFSVILVGARFAGAGSAAMAQSGIVPSRKPRQ